MPDQRMVEPPALCRAQRARIRIVRFADIDEYDRSVAFHRFRQGRIVGKAQVAANKDDGGVVWHGHAIAAS